ncbi:MAG TPA: methionyl-tRNA formyltransferase [Steroidobacteraceae bacterium]|nr:methionyl-tRNA formyltransferase [Steroidobacteraceae bacterium]
MSALRVVFAGTPEFAVPVLQALARSRHALVGVLTQPDRPAGRGRRVTASAVKTAALELGLAVEQPATLKDADAARILASWHPDVLVVVAYGLLLPAAILEVPPRGCINVHGSLLPRWRGAAPIERALLAGDRETGVSIMHMDRGLDTGPVYAAQVLAIRAEDTAGRLRSRLAALGAQALLDVLGQVADGTARALPQDSALATYAPKIEKAEARIDWRLAAEEIERRVRAFNPWPVAESRWRDQQLRVWGAHVVEREVPARPGAVIELPGAPLAVACGINALALDVVQLAGRKAMPAADFLRAHAAAGTVLE